MDVVALNGIVNEPKSAALADLTPAAGASDADPDATAPAFAPRRTVRRPNETATRGPVVADEIAMPYRRYSHSDVSDPVT